MAEESGYKATATSYPGVAFIVGTHPSTGKPDKIFYISYYRGGKRKHEKAGRASIDGMTAAKANAIRPLRMEGKELPNGTAAPRRKRPGRRRRGAGPSTGYGRNGRRRTEASRAE